MEKACALEERLIFAIGNAPTALIRLYELIQEGKIRRTGNRSSGGICERGAVERVDPES